MYRGHPVTGVTWDMESAWLVDPQRTGHPRSRGRYGCLCACPGGLRSPALLVTVWTPGFWELSTESTLLQLPCLCLVLLQLTAVQASKGAQGHGVWKGPGLGWCRCQLSAGAWLERHLAWPGVSISLQAAPSGPAAARWGLPSSARSVCLPLLGSDGHTRTGILKPELTDLSDGPLGLQGFCSSSNKSG